MKTSFRGARLGILGLMRSSTVTAAMALILVDAVLWMEEKQALGQTQRRLPGLRPPHTLDRAGAVPLSGAILQN